MLATIPTRRDRPQRAVAWLGAWALALAACGPSGGDDPTPTAGLAATQTPTPPPTPQGEATDGGSLSPRAVHIATNLDNPLSCWVSWETDEASPSRVEFGHGERYTQAVSDPAPVTQHKILVFGMRAQTAYRLRVGAQDGEGRWAWVEGQSFRTPSLPPEVYPLDVRTAVPGAMQPGWTLTNNHNKQLGHPPTAVIYDAEGEVVWYHVGGPYADDLGSVDTSLTADGHILIGPSGLNPAEEVTVAGEVVWLGPPQPNTGTDQAHHHCQRLSNGEYVTLIRATEDERFGDRVVRYDRDYNVTFDWNPFDYLAASGDADWTHNNSVTVDLEGRFTYVNSRNLSKLFKIDDATGQIVWIFGQGGDFAPDPDAEWPFPLYQHDPELEPGGTWLIYDNGNENYDVRPFTRVVEFALDEATMTSKIVWEWPGAFDVPEDYRGFHAPLGGDADRLPNGNTLITIAMRTADDGPTRLVEVTHEGQVVWEGLLPMTEEWTVGAYRSERIPALVEQLP